MVLGYQGVVLGASDGDSAISVDHAFELVEPGYLLAVGGDGLDVGGWVEVALGSEDDCDQTQHDQQ